MQNNDGTLPEFDLLVAQLKRLLKLVADQAEKITQLQDELLTLEHERDALLSERGHLVMKIEAAQLHVKAILEQLPVNN